ncbi:hypothetical protein B9K06_05410 [Bacillus sp. OG2]|nr:hypothetical protein B9K06_05410 [Bacillus sp. OG2]
MRSAPLIAKKELVYQAPFSHKSVKYDVLISRIRPWPNSAPAGFFHLAFFTRSPFAAALAWLPDFFRALEVEGLKWQKIGQY